MRDAAPGRGWQLDAVFAVFTRVGGNRIYPSRAVDERGQVAAQLLLPARHDAETSAVTPRPSECDEQRQAYVHALLTLKCRHAAPAVAS